MPSSTRTYNLRKSITLSPKAKALTLSKADGQFVKDTYRFKKVLPYSAKVASVLYSFQCPPLNKPSLRRAGRGPEYVFDIPEPVVGDFPLPVESLLFVRCRGRCYHARRLAEGRLYQMFVYYDDHSQTEVFADDCVGIWNAQRQDWDETAEGYEYVREWA
jgi:hypothetical protein